MQLGDWNQVEALSAAQARTKARLQDTAAVRAVAASVYGFQGVLVEGFDDTAPGAAEANPVLLAALGLERRRGESRARLERVLRDHGAKVVSDAGLDPQRFRLVCIPPDLHLRAGEKRGWGNQPHWTHFDGYMVQDRKFLDLAGGDVRFGGGHDIVALNRDNDSPSLVARLAVAQRARLAAW
jgi:hypothetical protein